MPPKSAKKNEKKEGDISLLNNENTLKLQLLQKKFLVSNLKLTHFKNNLAKFDNITDIPKSDLEIRRDVLTNLHVEYNNLMEGLIDIEEDEDFESLSLSLEEFNNEIIELIAHIHTVLDTFDEKPKQNCNVDWSYRQRPKLPQLPIPSFSGSPGDWVGFKSTFTALVHDDPNLSGVVKFSYLLDRLDEETKLLLGAITLTDEGYDCAWQTLLNSFDNKRKIIDHHIDALLNLANVSKDNPKELRQLINTCTSNVSALELCDQNLNDLGEQLLINIVLKKLNIPLRKEWEEEIDVEELPSWEQLMEFLKKKCRVLDSVESLKPQAPSSASKPASDKSKARPKSNSSLGRSHSFVNTASPKTTGKPNTNNKTGASAPTIDRCCVCSKGEHYLFNCPEFLNMSSHERLSKAKDHRYCINCLKSSRHYTRDCTAIHCKVCGQLHHTLLHHVQDDSQNDSHQVQSKRPSDEAQASTSKSAASSNESHTFQVVNKSQLCQVLLPTAIVLVKDTTGKYQECRALLDSGSQPNFVTVSCADKLKIPIDNNTGSRSVLSINENSTLINGQISTVIKSRNSDFEQAITMLVVPTIAPRLPQFSFDVSLWDIPKNIKLADPMFSIQRPIDILLGSELFFKALGSNQISIGEHLPEFRQTTFGYIATGHVDSQSLNFAVTNHTNGCNDDLQNSIQKLFDLDPVIEKPIFSQEEKYCEQYFKDTTFRDETGRYVVSLPLKDDVKKLGESKQQALKRFLYLERKLDSNPSFKKEYSDVINDYKELHHMDQVDESQDSPNQISFYLPHHAVIKPSSTTTKVRVVFDASAKSTTNISLNDVMMLGPTVQQSCFDITLRFRKHDYVFTCDVSKMYRQIKIDKSQTSLQRILWRSHKNEPLKVYELNTVTFGTASAPFLATRTLNQIALDEKQNYPQASQVALNDFYVDDCLSGSNNLNDVKVIIQQLREMLLSAGLELRKWCANNPKLLEGIPIMDQEVLKPNDVSPVECIKALGIAWQPTEDKFLYLIPPIEVPPQVTKRTILSQVAKLYDPLGLLAPVLITAKILIQKMWLLKSDWDDLVPSDILESWHTYLSTISCLNDLRIDRKILCKNPKSIQFHGFSDASEAAYGACIYLRSLDDSGTVSVQLVCSKTRVSPLKSTSLPRLELCGALLLSRLYKIVSTALDIKFDQVYLWSDSSITLAWINTESYKLKTFIANRVNEIQDLTKDCRWMHVRSENNPADIISRGIMPDQMKSTTMWFHGPQFLYNQEVDFTELSPAEPSNFDPQLLEIKPNFVNLVAMPEENSLDSPLENDLISRYSSYSKLLRISSLCIRFMKNCRTARANRITGIITTSELRDTLNRLVGVVQSQSFSKEIKCLTGKLPLSPKSPILSLSPFLDSTNILRVGGRLQNINLNYDRKHQILLPAKHHFTDLVIRHYHLTYLHAGPQSLVSFVRQKFWPISAKNSAKKCVRTCLTCFKCKPQANQQIMGQIPSDRFLPIRPFAITGIDYCGPFMLKTKPRNAPKSKVWVAIFICFTFKCVHIEVVTDLTSATFIACLKRFLFRRGKPDKIWSDNATTFVGAKRELKELAEFFKNDNNVHDITNYCTSQELQWKFIPPRSPNFGGIWESAVKLFKTHLKRVMLDTTLNFEEFNTLVIEIEGILNSRPLTVLSEDPNDPMPLTPSHFLCGSHILAPPEPSLLDIPSNRLSNWQIVTKTIQSFWKRYSIEYLHSLQQKNKWKVDSPNLKPNDVVMIVDDQLPSTQWLMGVITDVVTGPDNMVRVANIKTKNGVFKRGISKICKLPFE